MIGWPVYTVAGKYTFSGPNVNVGIVALSSRREGDFVVKEDVLVEVLNTRVDAILK
jgi:hypothetical protein